MDVWNEVAEQVAAHASKGSRLVVSGKLVQDKCVSRGVRGAAGAHARRATRWTDKETGKPRSLVRITAFKVAALEPYRCVRAFAGSCRRSLSMPTRNSDSMAEESTSAAPMRAPVAKPAAAAAAPAKSKPATGAMTVEDREARRRAAPARDFTAERVAPRSQAHFLDLLYYPQNWYDNRPQPADSKRPDFKHRSTDLALWLEDPNRRVHSCFARAFTAQRADSCATCRPSRLPAYVADYMGHRGQDPPPKWTPPSDESSERPASDASASPF